MHTEPLVSIVIPTYNRARLLTKALDSVLNQTYKNIQIIVIDDGSNDDTRAVLSPYMNRICYLTTDHKGAAHARNAGMKAATGKYIGFIDSDDIYLPHKLEIQVAFIEAHPEVDMVFTEFSGNYNNRYIEEYHMRSYHPLWIRKNLTYNEIFPVKGTFPSDVLDRPIPFYIGNLFKYALQDTLIPSNTILFSKHILEQIGYQDETIRSGQDYEFAVRICKYTDVAFLNYPTYIILHHGDQLSNRFRNSRDRRILDAIDLEMLFLKVVSSLAYEDKAYYHKNRRAVDSRLAEIYFRLSILLLVYDDKKNARKCFNYSAHYDPNKQKRQIFRWLLSMPLTIRQLILILYFKYYKWKLIFENHASLDRILIKMGIK